MDSHKSISLKELRVKLFSNTYVVHLNIQFRIDLLFVIDCILEYGLVITRAHNYQFMDKEKFRRIINRICQLAHTTPEAIGMISNSKE